MLKRAWLQAFTAPVFLFARRTAFRRFAVLGAVLFWILLACLPALALNSSLDASQYAHTAWTVRSGFSRGTIVSIAQTHDGYLWLGSEFGLFRFDGVRQVLWQPPAGQTLPSSYVRGLFVARDGRLWIGTNRGLASWKDGKLTRYPQTTGQSISELLEDREGTLWAAGQAAPSAKLCAIRSDNVQCYGEEGRFGQYIDSLCEDRDGNLWVGSLTGLWQWKPNAPKRYPMAERVYAMIAAANDPLLLAKYSGIGQFSAGKLQAYPLPGVAGGFLARKILRDRNGGLWIGTADRGLLHVHNGRTDTFERSDGLSSDFIESVFEDREGNIWVATLDGLDRFRELAIPTITVKQGLSNGTVKAVLATKDGSVWLATNDGLDRLKDNQLTIYRKATAKAKVGSIIATETQNRVREISVSGLQDDLIQSLYQDFQDRIWVSNRSGVAFFEDGQFTPVDGVPGDIHSITGDREGNIWISQEASLIHLHDNKVVESISWAKLGRTDGARALIADPSGGGLWIAFRDTGVAYFKDGQIRASYTIADGLGIGTVREFQSDRQGAFWISTEGGLSRLKDGRIATLSSKNGLPCDTVNWMIQDDNNSFWLNMACGLVRLAQSDVDAWATTVDKDHGRRVRATLFDSSDGVRSHLTSSGYGPSVDKSTDGRLWFSPWDGVSVIDPRHLAFETLPPSVQIEQIIADRRAMDTTSGPNGVGLPPLLRDLQIDYTALNLGTPEKSVFRYKLEGWDRDWQEAGNRRQAFYSNLSPGNYRFRVSASNNNGVWTEAGTFLDFSIAPAYYQTIWFRLSCAITLVALAIALYQLRLRQVARQFNIRMEERVNERTRIARELHDTLLQSLAGVSLQLDGISKQAAKAPEKTVSLIAHVREQVDFCFREARIKVWNLRSTALDGIGLEVALHEFVERVGTLMSARCSFKVSGKPLPYPPEVEEELLHIAQEATNNANRHAQASEIQIALEYDVAALTLSISDDGKGFDFESGFQKPGHWGLKNMQERAAQVRGTCKITTAMEQGTQVEVRVPLSSWFLKNIRTKHAHSSASS